MVLFFVFFPSFCFTRESKFSLFEGEKTTHISIGNNNNGNKKNAKAKKKRGWKTDTGYIWYAGLDPTVSAPNSGGGGGISFIYTLHGNDTVTLRKLHYVSFITLKNNNKEDMAGSRAARINNNNSNNGKTKLNRDFV